MNPERTFAAVRQECFPCQWKVFGLVVLTSLTVIAGCDANRSDSSEAETNQPAEQSASPTSSVAMPEQFVDVLRFNYGPKHSEPVLLDTPVTSNVNNPERVEFDMAFVPGDPQAGIEPFYLSTTEVTAEAFYPWATGTGLIGEEWEHYLTLNPRPSQINWELLSHGPVKRPALGMSRTVAEFYCKWLSQQTGRAYRLPTEAEWLHALRRGGGIPDDREALLEQAVLKENAEEQLDPPFLYLPAAVGRRAPNALGLFDMLGNAAEWVSGTGSERIVRGGHFMLPAEELTADWRAVEDLDVWNETYPQRPISVHWYRDFYFTGIRLACDADQAPQPDEKPDPDIP